VKDKMKEWEEDFKSLSPFAPNVRSSVVMIKMTSKEDVFEFIAKWKESDIIFKGRAIRATTDKPPEQRKANAKIYNMTGHLKSVFIDKEVDADFRNASVWLGDWEVVKWDIQAEAFKWIEDGMSKAGVVVDRAEAEKKANEA
jgi:hypothetical protein